MLSRKLHLPWVAAVVAALLAVTAVLTARSALAYDFTKPTKLAQTMGGSTQLEVEWLHVSGAPAYMVEVKTGSTTLKVMTGNNTAVLKPLKRATTYSIRVAVAADTSASAKRMSDWSSTMKLKTSNNALNPPTDLTVTKSATSSATLKWTPPEGVLSTDRYSVTYALNSGLKKSAKTAVTEDSTPSITLTSMTSDTNFYVRVKVVGTDGKTVRSDTSDFGLIKTRAQTGVISGKVTDGTAAHIVVAAYDASGELVSQVDPSSSGAFKLTVRPGTYTVQASYIGTGGTISLWSKSDSAGVPTRAQATTYTVAEGKTVTLPDAIELSGGGKATGIVTDSSSGAAVRDVDVTALLSGEVIARAATDGNGAYTLDGLPSGSYTLRFKYRGAAGTGVGFKAVNLSQKITAGKTTEVGNQALPLAAWAKQNKPYVSGTKKVGKTVKRGGNTFVASLYPLERATSWRYQWYRSGKAISGATGYSYKLTKSDKGKKISLRVTYYHIGFATTTVSTKSYTVK